MGVFLLNEESNNEKCDSFDTELLTYESTFSKFQNLRIKLPKPTK
jgi:hypothetical protein